MDYTMSRDISGLLRYMRSKERSRIMNRLDNMIRLNDFLTSIPNQQSVVLQEEDGSVFFSGSAYDVRISLGDPDIYVTEATFDRTLGGTDWIIHIVQ